MIRLTHSSLQLPTFTKVFSKSRGHCLLANARFTSSLNSLILEKQPKGLLLSVKPCGWIQSSLLLYSSDAQKNRVELTSEEDQKKLIFTIPNVLTSLRILSIPFINYFIFIGMHEVACGLFVASALTDALDGYIARNVPNQMSHLGSILDPLADKLLIGSLTFTLMLINMMPFPLFAVIISRDLGLILSSLYIRYKIIDEPKTFSKYINLKKYASVKVEADSISKFNTAVQVALISLTLPSVMLGYSDSTMLVYLQWFTGFTTALSAGSYLYKRGSYKLR